MSVAGNAIGTAIIANKIAATATFNAGRKPGPYSPAELQQLLLAQSQAEGNAIVDNLPSTQSGGGVANWDGGQANSNYGGTIAISGGTA